MPIDPIAHRVSSIIGNLPLAEAICESIITRHSYYEIRKKDTSLLTIAWEVMDEIRNMRCN